MKSFQRIVASRMAPALFLWLLLVASASAQPGARSRGQHFLIAFPDTTMAFIAGNDPAMSSYAALIIFSSSQATVSIRSGAFSRSVAVGPNASTVVPLIEPGGPARVFFDRQGVVDGTIFDVTSDREIGIYCYFVTKDGSEAFSPLPVESWGREYYGVGFPSDFVSNLPVAPEEENPKPLSADAPAEVLVIASEDNTTVRVNGPPGIAFPAGGAVRLDAGEGYLLETLPPVTGGSRDITGTYIIADKPIGVIAGNTRTAYTDWTRLSMFTGNSANNSMVEWVPPVEAAGTTFHFRRIAPIIGPIVGFMEEFSPVLRCMAIAPGITTVLSSSGEGLAIGQGMAKDMRLGPLPAPGFRVTSDKPMLAFMSTGLAAWNIDAVDGITGYNARASSMAELVPEERWISSGRFHSPGYPEYLRHYVSIVADAQVFLDGRPVAMTAASVAGYREAMVEVGVGDHLLTAEGCGRFGALAYGQARGYEEYIPLLSRRKDETIASAPHPSVYKEKLGIAYAYPVLGATAEDDRAGTISMGRDYVAVPGDPLLIPIMFDGDMPAGTTSLSFVVSFDSMLIGAAKDMRDRLTEGTMLAGWSVTDFREEAGRVTFTLTAPPGAPPVGPGRLVSLGFASFIRIVDSLTLLPDEYADVTARIMVVPTCGHLISSPGRVHFTICGTNSRQIERTEPVTLDRSRPNPFGESTEIGFSLPFPLHVTLRVFDGSGRNVATLVDGELAAGHHVVTWDATGLPPGLYRYRLVAGEWSADGSMVLMK